METVIRDESWSFAVEWQIPSEESHETVIDLTREGGVLEQPLPTGAAAKGEPLEASAGSTNRP